VTNHFSPLSLFDFSTNASRPPTRPERSARNPLFSRITIFSARFFCMRVLLFGCEKKTLCVSPARALKKNSRLYFFL